ncbi:MAG: DUF3801 domain-containing protein [Oscillospiraceae bacterium]
MMLSGGEVAIKLAGSAAKNAAAMLLALARNHKKVYGKTSLKKILQQTRDIRTFSLTPEQYREFSRQAKDKVLFAGIQDKEQPDAPIDLVIPTTDLELANVIFERLFGSLEKPQEERSSKKKSLGRNPPWTISPAARLRAGRTRRMTARRLASSFSPSAKSCPVSNRAFRPEKKTHSEITK